MWLRERYLAEREAHVALVKNLSTTLQIPGEDGEWVKIRRLSYLELQNAREIRTRAVFANMREMGGEVMRELRSADTEAVEAAASDPLNDYDVATLLKAGITEWSYPDAIEHPARQLDPATAEWAAREILAYCGIGRDEADRKNA